jgi:purine-binding chemotaxis protein CheW
MTIQGGKFLSFLLGEEIYAIPIKKAKEIIGMMAITHIPKLQGYMRGVINLRGKIIPIMDLRLRVGMAEQAYTERTCIIIVEVGAQGNQRLVGIAVDAVSEVVTIQTDNIEAPPEFDTQIEGSFLTGLGKLKEKVVLILEIEKILNREELAGLKQQLNLEQEISLLNLHHM